MMPLPRTETARSAVPLGQDAIQGYSPFMKTYMVVTEILDAARQAWRERVELQ